jgi:hypothetical protein
MFRPALEDILQFDGVSNGESEVDVGPLVLVCSCCRTGDRGGRDAGIPFGMEEKAGAETIALYWGIHEAMGPLTIIEV